MKLPGDMETNMLLRNNSPIDDFLGLSANQMHQLLYEPFGDKSPVQFRNDINDKTLDQIPLFRIAEEYIKIVQRDKHIKLTPLGALPKKVIVELYGKGFLPEEHIESGITKLWREDDCTAIKSARLTVEIAGLVRKANGKLTVTKTGLKLLDSNNRLQMFKLFFQAFTGKFLWSYNDGYPEQPVGQLGWAFSVIMLNRFGNQFHPVDFYANKYLNAFPMFIAFFRDGYIKKEQLFTRCYGIRTFHRFLFWFGFVTVVSRQNYTDVETDKYKKTDLLKAIFKVEDQ